MKMQLQLEHDVKERDISREASKMSCRKCDYDWESRVEDPKACPRCKTRLDYVNGKKE